MGSRTAIFAAVVLISLMVSGCGWLTSNRVGIENQSGVKLTNVHIVLPGQRLLVGEIAAGETKIVRGSAQRDGVMVLEYTRAGRSFAHELAYVAPPFRVSCDVVISRESLSRRCQTR
jgi:hypothetical protein